MSNLIRNALLVVVLAVPALAQASSPSERDEAYFTVGAVEVHEVGVEDGEDAPMTGFALEDGNPLDDLNDAKIAIDTIINIGKEVWKIIEANKPVVNQRFDVAHALPQGIQSAFALEAWQSPKSRVFRTFYKNLYGANVVDFTFRVLYTYGGSLAGKGAYLTNVTVLPAELNVAWGYTFEAEGVVPSILNVGTSADPVAGMSLDLKWKVVTVMKHHERTQSFFIRGDGAFENLSDGN